MHNTKRLEDAIEYDNSDWKPLTSFTKNSILDVWKGSKYVSTIYLIY